MTKEAAGAAAQLQAHHEARGSVSSPARSVTLSKPHPSWASACNQWLSFFFIFYFCFELQSRVKNTFATDSNLQISQNNTDPYSKQYTLLFSFILKLVFIYSLL